ncbi:MAG: ester cyclase [Streptosporangiaceae bacterium]
MTEKHNAATVLGLLDAAWNNGDTEAIEHTITADHIEHEADGAEIGRNHVTQTILAYRVAFPDLHMSVEDQISQGDKVVTRWTATGTHRAELNGIPATGRTATVSGIFIHRVTAGRIAETWTSFDGLGLLQQLGVVPADAAEA